MINNWQGKRLLIAEDEEDNYELLCAILEDTGVEIVKALNGYEAIQKFKSEVKGIDLILMDIKMPELDGLEATKVIRKLDNNVPIIAQTAYALSGDKEKALAAGCNSYIPKPIDYDMLINMVGKYLNL